MLLQQYQFVLQVCIGCWNTQPWIQFFFKRIFKELSMTTNYVTDYMKYRDKRKECKRNYQQRIDVKVNRSKNKKKPRRSLPRTYQHQLWTRCGFDGWNGENRNKKNHKLMILLTKEGRFANVAVVHICKLLTATVH
jgi:hypothetical protein